MHLALDWPALIDVVKDVAPMMVGGFLYPFSELAAPQQERDKWLGYQAAPAVSQTGSTSFLQHPAAPEPPFEVESLCGLGSVRSQQRGRR
jgi:hypothetical protein